MEKKFYYLNVSDFMEKFNILIYYPF